MSSTVRFEDQIEIAASVEVLWSITEAIEAWPSITPTMLAVRRIEDGPLRVGATARIRQPGLREATWTVTAVDAPHHFVWRRRIFGLTMSAGHHLFPTPEGCRQSLTIDLIGPGARLFARIAGGRIEAAIARENRSFKRRAEQGRAATGF